LKHQETAQVTTMVGCRYGGTAVVSQEY
jgi:hypothetical protein